MIWKIGFYYLGCDVIGQFLSLGEGHRYLNISLGGSAQLCIEKLCHGLNILNIFIIITVTVRQLKNWGRYSWQRRPARSRIRLKHWGQAETGLNGQKRVRADRLGRLPDLRRRKGRKNIPVKWSSWKKQICYSSFHYLNDWDSYKARSHYSDSIATSG